MFLNKNMVLYNRTNITQSITAHSPLYLHIFTNILLIVNTRVQYPCPNGQLNEAGAILTGWNGRKWEQQGKIIVK